MHAKLLDKIVAARLELTVLKGRLKCESIDLSREATADILYYIIVILEEAKELVENDE